MSEPVDVKIARLEEVLKALVQRIDDTAMISERHRQATDRILGNLVAMTNEWAGVRKMLTVFGSVLIAVGGLIGWSINYFLPHR